MKIGFMFPLLLILSTFSCKKPGESKIHSLTWREYDHPVISQVSLYDTLDPRSLVTLNIKEIHGIKASYSSGKSTSYFEYDATPDKLLKVISQLSFKKSNGINDTTCRTINTPFSLSGRTILSEAEVTATDFFWQIQPDDFFYYECIKNPATHTLLINKKTGRIFHRIESRS